MRSSCITHPAREPLLVIRKSQVDFCQGNVCAAALLSFFEYWHNIRLDQAVKSEVENRIAEAHGEPPTQNVSLWQFHTAEELSEGIMGLYSRNKITEGIDLLVKLGAIEVGRNPNERYKFDNTRYFLLNPALINAWFRVNSGITDTSELTDRSTEMGRPSRSTGTPSRSNHATITETTEKITVGENPNSDFDFFSKNANGKSNGAGLVDAAELDGRVNRDYPQAIDREVGNLLDADQTGNGYSALNDPAGIAESPEQLAALQNLSLIHISEPTRPY